MTKTAAPSVQAVLDEGIPAELADVLAMIKFGSMLAPLKRSFATLTGAATYDLTKLDATGETAGAANPNRKALLGLRTLRITGATTATVVGTYVLTDKDGDTVSAATHTAVGCAKISDDGTTLTFPSADVTDFIIEYIPRAAVDMTTVPSGSGLGFSP